MHVLGRGLATSEHLTMFLVGNVSEGGKGDIENGNKMTGAHIIK
jgi:hypothetical protein